MGFVYVLRNPVMPGILKCRAHRCKDKRLVTLNGKEVYPTTATTSLLGTAYSVQPGPHWTYEGRSLADIYEDAYAT